jgi:hypothetical protein
MTPGEALEALSTARRPRASREALEISRTPSVMALLSRPAFDVLLSAGAGGGLVWEFLEREL